MNNKAMPNDELITACQKVENVYIYGAGKNASRIYRFLSQYGIQTEGFLVSELSGNPEVLFERRVVSIDNFVENSSYLIVVSISNGGRAYREIFDGLVSRGIYNAFFLTKNMLESIKEDVLLWEVRESFNAEPYHLAEKAPSEQKHAILAMKGTSGEEYHWRISLWGHFSSNISEVFQNKSALEEFEEGYGKYYSFHTLVPVPVSSDTCAVYMARSHVDNEIKNNHMPAWIVPIQAGAALADQDICEIKDNIGENISERNKNYSECTALYWMWQNAPRTDYIGLCHYRRHFDFEENELGRLFGLDALVTAPTFVEETVSGFFSTLLPKSDLQVMLEFIKKLHPEYYITAKTFLEGRFFPPCNLFIMKYELFQEYSEFVFSTTFEIEHFFDNIGFYRSDRYLGYLIECLMGIFLMKNKDRLKIGYTDMRFIN